MVYIKKLPPSVSILKKQKQNLKTEKTKSKKSATIGQPTKLMF